MCKERRVALTTGEMHFDKYTRRWYWPVASFGMWKRLPPYSWPFCPFCGGPLPKTAPTEQR